MTHRYIKIAATSVVLVAAFSALLYSTLREGADMKIGLDGPDGAWIAPVEKGHQNAKNTNDYNAGIIYGSNLPGSAIPASPSARAAHESAARSCVPSSDCARTESRC